MPIQTLIVVGLLVASVAFVAWQLVNSHRADMGRRGHKNRKSDRRYLTSSEKRAYKNAHKLFQEGNIKASAKVLEQLGMLRESINLLETSGLIKEAADSLMRIQRPNRAGHLLARHGLWKDALDCYKRAGMMGDVGRCAREIGDLATAIPYFLEAGAFEEAAECYLELGKHHESARLFLKIKDSARALEQFIQMVDSYDDIGKIDFLDEEINFIKRKLVDDKADPRLADILVARDSIVELIIDLIRSNNLALASAAYLRNTRDIGPELIAYQDFTRDESGLLCALFTNVGAYEYSGMVYERLGEFDRAGEAFEKGELFERAAYCYKRAMNKNKVTEMQIMSTQRGTRQIEKPAGSPSLIEAVKSEENSNVFSIENTATDAFILTEATAQLEISLDGGQLVAKVPKASDAYLKKMEPEAVKSDKHDSRMNWDAFYHSEFLLDLTTPEQATLQTICKSREYSPGSVILDFDQEPIGIYFLLRGIISVSKRQPGGGEIEIDLLKETDVFGELWLLMDQPSRVKFVAKSSVQLGFIKRADFEVLMDKNGAIARKLYKRYTHRLVQKLLNDEDFRTKQSAS